MKGSIHPSASFLSDLRRLTGVGRWASIRPHLRIRPGSPGLWSVLLLGFLVALPALAGASEPGFRRLAHAFMLQVFLYATAAHIGASLAVHPHLWAYTFWPASEESVVAMLLRRILRSGVWVSVSVAVGFGLASASLGSNRPVMAALQGLAMGVLFLPLALIQGWFLQRWRWCRWHRSVVLLAGSGAAFAHWVMPQYRPAILEWIRLNGEHAALAVPAGWLVLPWSAWAEGGPAWSALFLLPLPVVLLGLPEAWRSIRQAGRFRERALFHHLGELPEGAPEDVVESVQGIRARIDASGRPGPTANRDALLDRSFLRSGLAGPVEWVDRVAWRWWTPRQRLVAECLRPSWLESEPSLRAVLVGVSATWAGAALAFRNGRGEWILAFVAPVSLVLLWLVPWFSPFGISGRIRLLPIRIDEVAMLRWKHTALRSLQSLPRTAVCGLVCSWIADDPVWVGALIGAQIASAPAALSPLATAYGVLNRATTRGWQGGLAKGVVAGACLLNMIGFVLLVLPGFGAVAAVLLAGLNYAVLRLVIWRLDACRIEIGDQ